LGKHGEKRHISKISGGIPLFYMIYCARWCEIKNIEGKTGKLRKSGKVGGIWGETTWKFPGPRLLYKDADFEFDGSDMRLSHII
jgi:hypothetical protein